jgi:transposase
MEQRAVIRFLTLKGLKSKDILAKLEGVYGEGVLSLAAVKKWNKRFREGRTDLFDDPRSGRPMTHDLGQAIRSMLVERPFTSCKVLCRHFRVAKGTCLRILHDELGLKKLHLRWVPHTLDQAGKNERVTYSRALLEQLTEAQQDDFQHVVTGDESWFFLFYPRESAWVESRFDLPERTKAKFDTEKCLISILWSINGIHSLLDVPKGTTYNTAFFCEQVLPSLVGNITSHSRRKTLQNFLIHLDNARPHNSGLSRECLEATKAKRMPHPAYSPDLAPSDFFLFGYVKGKLTDYQCETRDELKAAISEIFGGIGKETLHRVFLEWMKRLKWVTKHKGEYYHN